MSSCRWLERSCTQPIWWPTRGRSTAAGDHESFRIDLNVHGRRESVRGGTPPPPPRNRCPWAACPRRYERSRRTRAAPSPPFFERLTHRRCSHLTSRHPLEMSSVPGRKTRANSPFARVIKPLKPVNSGLTTVPASVRNLNFTTGVKACRRSSNTMVCRCTIRTTTSAGRFPFAPLVCETQVRRRRIDRDH